MTVIAKTRRGAEYIAKAAVKERYPEAEVTARPGGHLGLLIIKGVEKECVEEIPEIERAVKVLAECRAELEEIKRTALSAARGLEFSTFAVRTVRRGNHSFTSDECTREVGEAIKSGTGAEVNLENPDLVFSVEIINDRAYIGILEGFRKKYGPGKTEVDRLLKKLVAVQMPYLGPGAREMGIRIGRSAQSFEIKELTVSPHEKVDAGELRDFLAGVTKGVKTRYSVQRRIYPRPVRRVRITVQSLYEVFREKSERRKTLVIVTDPTGSELPEIKERLKADLLKSEEVAVFIGAREGIPKGIIRKADYVIDLAPYKTLATEMALPASVELLVSVFEEAWNEEKQVVIFDLDGTLIDSVDYHVKTFAKSCELLGIRVDERLIREFRKRVGKRFEEIVREILPVDEETVKKLVEVKWKISDEFLDAVKPVEEAVRLIEELPDTTVLALFSSSPRKFIKKILRRLGLESAFSIIIGKNDVKKGKPDPEGVLKILEIAKVPPERCVFIGDTEYDRIAAERAGVRFVHIDEIKSRRNVLNSRK